MSKRYEETLKEAKVFYSTLQEVSCPALSNESVVFNAMGLKHIIRKGRFIRQKNDQLRRFRLLKYAKDILADPEVLPVHRKEESAEFWTFEKIYPDRKVIVIVRRLGNGNKHFFSIMDR